MQGKEPGDAPRQDFCHALRCEGGIFSQPTINDVSRHIGNPNTCTYSMKYCLPLKNGDFKLESKICNKQVDLNTYSSDVFIVSFVNDIQLCEVQNSFPKHGKIITFLFMN